MADSSTIFATAPYGSGTPIQGPPPPPAPQEEPPLVLTAADAVVVPPLRFQRTMIGLGGTFAVMMSALDRMPSALATFTKLPLPVIDQIRCGTASRVAVEDLCILAEALGCEIEVRLNPRQQPRPPA